MDACTSAPAPMRVDPPSGEIDIGARREFDDFYRGELPRLIAFASVLVGQRPLAEDLAQEAMLRAHRRWSRLATYDDPTAWVRRVVANLAASAFRRRAVEARGRLRLGPATDRILPDDGRDHTLWAAVAALPRQQRIAVALHYLEDRPVREIAAVLGCRESTAKVHLHKARTRLAESLGGPDV